MTFNLSLYLVSVLSFLAVVLVYSRGLWYAIKHRQMTAVDWIKLGIVAGFAGAFINAMYWGTENVWESFGDGPNTALWWDTNSQLARWTARPLQVLAAWLHLVAAFIGHKKHGPEIL